eukprot:15470908-Alexandrium_andersonii.AAC.1
MTPSAVDKVHKVAVGRSLHACEVMCGGMRTDASSVPGLSHVLWECPGYDRDPDIGKGDPLSERLGWSAPAGK